MARIIYVLIGGLLLFTSSAGSQDAVQYFNNGLALLKAQNYVEAIKEFTQAISLDPDYAEAYYHRAITKDLLAQKEGMNNYELCYDLLKATMLGHRDASKMLVKKSQAQCYNIKNFRIDPEIVFCADFSSNVLNDLPPHAEELGMLMSLNLFNNRFTKLGKNIAENHPFLVYINLMSNQISEISPEIAQLELLTELNLSENQLQTIPTAVCRLKNLKVLILSSNKINSIPNELKNLTFLEVLDLSSNQLTNVPPVLCEMKHLKELMLTANHIDKKQIEQLQKTLSSTKIYF
ncbi:MAG: leucine-rich repeat domain-containing protein [Cytophagales bacterium]|nr:leucine-rich repeat domain-containing protein [Cytophagales bacterium]MDW8385171.1 leucine-rich repeat domain-containing protein [Flammeovirgaceae bacterium]